MSGSSSASARPALFRFSLPCDPAHVREAVRKAIAFLGAQDWDGKSLMSFDLALTEACNNAVEHVATPEGRKKLILLEVVSGAEGAEFRIHDHTPGFQWPEKAQLPPPESEGGRGVFLIASLMDSAGYFRGRDANILVARKSRPPGFVANSHANTPEDQSVANLVEELSSCYESLSAIFRYSAEPGKTGGLKEFAVRMFGDLLPIISADWFVVRIVIPGRSQLAVLASSAGSLELESLALPASGETAAATAIEIESVTKRRTVWFDNQSAPRPGDPLYAAFPGAAGLVTPVIFGEELMGTVALGKKAAPGIVGGQGALTFKAGQINVVNTFVDFLAVQIANDRFQEDLMRQRLVAHELEIASNIQRSLLPATLPRLPGFGLAAWCRSAREVGGDFYDVLQINDHCLLLVIADVMGKGIPAALFAAILSTVMRAAPELTQQPAALLTRVNQLLFPELSGVAMFITAQLAFVDARARKITVASAGHCPLILATDGPLKICSPEGMPLGVMADILFEEETMNLPEHSRVLMFSDGVTDAVNAQQEPFGQQRLLDWFSSNATTRRTSEQLKLDLIAALEKHQGNLPLKDDLTFVIMSDE